MTKGQRSLKRNADNELTREQILTATEETLRRFGPMKTTVVDIAVALGVSHGSVYRHFESKAALLDAVIEGWLRRFSVALEKIVRKPGPASERLRLWLETIRELKTNKYQQEVELVDTYHQLVRDSAHVVDDYYKVLTTQLETIIAAGIASGEFKISDAGAGARAVIDATTKFHHPWHAASWHNPGIDKAFEDVWDLLLRGLTSSENLVQPQQNKIRNGRRRSPSA